MGEGTGKRKKPLKNKASTFNNTAADHLDSANADKKMKKVAKTKKRKSSELETTEIAVSSTLHKVDDGKNSAAKSAKRKSKLKKKKNQKDRVDEYALHSNEVEDDINPQSDTNLEGITSGKKMKNHARKKKRKGAELPTSETTEIVVSTTPDDVNEAENSDKKIKKSKNKLKEKKKDRANRKKVRARENVSHSTEIEDVSKQQKGKSNSVSEIGKDSTLLDDEEEVYQISSGDEDETTGMRRWIEKYHRARPGPEVLSQNIDSFLIDYWAEKEKEKKQKEEEAAEGGWTVVTHNKGRKKTTDAESGTTVGSVAQAAVMDKMSNKKKKKEDVGIDFYRFQKREAQRNEIMMLQSKFEQDKKRIQELRAARKFRPY
ncbi:uncharacterized protein [Rutidosis leptorrhynchoides]|uniref:uncharacterized protein n=1 Tax=Rutidosis leptorrhynchoides TaxID=125765 RepID=UPI003A991109